MKNTFVKFLGGTGVLLLIGLATPQSLAQPTSAPATPPGVDPRTSQLRFSQNSAPGQAKAAPQPIRPATPPVPAGPTPTVQLKPGEIPAIEFDTPTYDFGRIKAGIDVSHDYWFTNTGSGPLEILSVKPS